MSLRHTYMEKRAQQSRRRNQVEHGSLIYFSDSQVKSNLGPTIHQKHELVYLDLLEIF